MSAEPFERARLSAREEAILASAIEGMTDIQIAQHLEITPSTVNSYWVRIRGKLGHLSRTELVALALKQAARDEMAIVVARNDLLQGEADQHARITEDFENAEIFRSALDAIPEPTLVVCALAIVRFANARLEGMFGYGPGELVGRSLAVLVPPAHWAAEESRIAAYLRNPRPIRLGLSEVLYGQRRDGSLFRIVLLVDFRPTTTGPIFTCVVRDFVSEIESRRAFASTWS